MKTCYICKAQKDTRPYGENYQDLCFDCLVSNPILEEIATRNFDALLQAAGDKVLLTENGPVPLNTKNKH